MQNRKHNESVRGSPMLVERFRYRLPGFNRRTFTLRDLFDICDEINVRVKSLPMQLLHGCSFVESGEVFLYVNSLLARPEQVIAGFHEYCHITDHCFGVEVFQSTGNLWNLSKREYQAQIIGALALMPATMISGLTVVEIMYQFGVRREIAEFRASLMI
jgi:Zn-dependent peptidase ImmA (M78 family)